jgi:O-antigen ligase
MTDPLTSRPSREIWVSRVALGWAVAVLAADLKVNIPRIHWALSALAVILILPYLLRVRWKARFPARVPAWLFIVAVCVPVLYGASALYSLAEAGKFAAILLGGISIFVALTNLAHYAFRGFIIAMWLNAFLLLGGLLGFGSANIMMTGRWGTILNYPGELWRVGITVWVFAAYLLIKRRSVASLGLWVASTALVYLDGTRTGILLLFVGALYLLFVLAVEAGRLKRALTISATGLGILAGVVAYSGILSGQVGGGAVGRFSELAVSVEAEGFKGLDAADAIRFQMLQDVLEAIRAHPVLGTGFETTMTESIIGPMSIHMTYLQLWADLGLLGFVAYVWLMWGWLIWVPRVLRRVRAFSDPARRAIYYNAMFLLVVYGSIGFFHPVSTEWSDWILFIVPYALVWEVARSKVVVRPSLQALEAQA